MFPTRYPEISALIDAIDPVKYGQTRNYLDGAVTKLSPYISRGVISTRQVAQAVLKKGYSQRETESLLKELAWRDYFQQVWRARGDEIDQDLKQTQTGVSNRAIPRAIVNASTRIEAIDNAIAGLYNTGYMHNHLRMYVAAVCCNVGQSHWLWPARWMYYHLLDADWASNALSWQWVAGSFSTKKYYANQENINKFCATQQHATFLDLPYERLETMPIPEVLRETMLPELTTVLPATKSLQIDTLRPTYVYTFYNLDVNWDSDRDANRILLLEPEFFRQYPVSDKTIQFVLKLSENIRDIQLFVGEFNELPASIDFHQLHYKEHPANRHFTGHPHPRDWMTNEVEGYFPSFFQFWKLART